MYIKGKIRKFAARIHWPLVTRSRFMENSANYDAEIKQLEIEKGDLANAYRNYKTETNDRLARLEELVKETSDLRDKLAEAQKNDHHDPETGRFISAVNEAAKLPPGSVLNAIQKFTDK